MQISKIQKFGGTSMGSASRMGHVAELINDGESKIVVLSAMSGTTNNLVEIAKHLAKQDHSAILDVLMRLNEKYNQVISELYQTPEFIEKSEAFINSTFGHLQELTQKPYSIIVEKEILAQGELLSTHLFSYYLLERGIDCQLIPALDFMRINKYGEPVFSAIEMDLTKILNQYPNQKLFITQGFICRNANGEIDNLQRGGSDYSASIIGSVMNVDEIQIWTDIDGMHNNDPRIVQNTKPVPQLHFEEAAELAYFGAKILHPTCILPAKDKNIKVRLLNTMDPKAEGTTISNEVLHSGIAAIAAKDGITSIKIKSSRMLLAYGFLRKVFQIFEDFQTPIDLITTSEVGVSVTIDNDQHLNEIKQQLEEFGTVTIETDMTIICVVGQILSDTIGLQSKVLQAFQDIPIRMVSYGGSNYNISFIVRAEDKIKALQTLHNTLFV
ncbi:MAG: aspartate kinase [Bacteroidales bacterium]|jgi:aspartate kinase|nr:aspartate kinase [Bacteroidales bacterium]